MFEETRLRILKRHLGELVAAPTPETSTINQLVQIWAYHHHAHRSAPRAALWADPD
ncbi:NIPSNAP family protein [Sphingobium aromaticiconvertens]|uniref:NIPSNAP family protein n=1 Tax=Sphingobium aromaticiconvertens TaxID=365341 RepID=UPI003AFB53F1